MSLHEVELLEQADFTDDEKSILKAWLSLYGWCKKDLDDELEQALAHYEGEFANDADFAKHVVKGGSMGEVSDPIANYVDWERMGLVMLDTNTTKINHHYFAVKLSDS